MKIGVIVGSIREGNKGQSVGRWVHEHATSREGVEYELIELASFDVPLLTANTPPAAAKKQYEDARVQRWSAAIDACDAFIFVTPEYNHSVPGAFKNAFDCLSGEWLGKPVGFVSYGSDGGVRAVEAWRLAVATLQMYSLRAQVSLGLFTDFGEDGFAPTERRAGELDALFDQLEAAAARFA